MNSIYGTTSNAEGLFTLRLPDSLTADTLHISYVGYIPDYVAVSHLIDSQYTIALQPDFIPIQEVVIRHAQGPELVAKAIAQIPNNYYKEAINLTAFYRESIYKNNELAAITEAVLELYKSKQINNFDQLKLVKGRNLVDNQRHDTLAVKIKAGIDLAMLLDVVREKPDFLQDDGHQFYQYKMADIMKINEKDHFVISFEQHAHINMPLYKGYLYINAEDLAISRLEFEVNPAHVHKMYGMVSKKPRNYKVKPHRMDYTIVYTNSDNGYALNFFQCSLEFRIRKKKQWFYRHYNTRIEMAVTETITRDVHRFKLNELANSQKILSEETGAYDPAFWALYNFIAPDMPLQEALGRLFDVNY